jgi:Fe-S cluster biogenesis protein NfuA
VSDLAAEVTAALGRSILPSVIARGAVGLRVVAVEDGVVTLAADGSPGAVLPILGRIEAQLRAADGWIRVRLEGGCQGCSLAEVTLRQGIEPVLRARLPAMTGLVDVTEHEAGTEPFFSPAKR